MNTHLNSIENINELVFENKNKAYGAYALRKSYKDNMTISLVLSSAFFGILALLAVVFTHQKIGLVDITGDNQPIITTIIRDIIIPQPVKPINVEKPAAAPKTTSGQMQASDDKKDLIDKTNDQKIISKNPITDGKDSAGTKDPVLVLPPVKLPPPPIEHYAQQMPQMDNMAKFITDNLKYPHNAIENGTSGIVYVTFVVEMDGSITDIKLLKGIGDGCEQEAMRVVGLMPKWKPGMSNGKVLRVQCNLPVSFRLK